MALPPTAYPYEHAAIRGWTEPDSGDETEKDESEQAEEQALLQFINERGKRQLRELQATRRRERAITAQSKEDNLRSERRGEPDRPGKRPSKRPRVEEDQRDVSIISVGSVSDASGLDAETTNDLANETDSGNVSPTSAGERAVEAGKDGSTRTGLTQAETKAKAKDLKTSKKKRKKVSVPSDMKALEFSKQFPTAQAYVLYLRRAPEDRHPMRPHKAAALAGVRAYFVTTEKTLTKSLAIQMDNITRHGGLVQSAFVASFGPGVAAPPVDATTHVIAYKPAGDLELRFKDILKILGLQDDASLVGAEVAGGDTSARSRPVWVVQHEWLVETCKLIDAHREGTTGAGRASAAAKRKPEFAHLVQCAGDKQRSKRAKLEMKRSSGNFGSGAETSDRVGIIPGMEEYHMPESQLSTEEQRRLHRPQASPPLDEGSQSQQIWQSHIPVPYNESPLSFSDIAVEIDMARSGLDAYVDDEEDVEGTFGEAQASQTSSGRGWVTDDNYILPSKRSAPIESDECDSDEEDAYRARKEQEKRDITKAAREEKRKSGSKYRCDASNAAGGAGQAFNEETARIFDALASWYEKSKEHNAWWRVKGYRTAAGALRNVGRTVDTFEDAVKLPGIGEKTAIKLIEIVQTGRCSKLDNKSPREKVELMLTDIYGVGPSKATEWYNAGIRTLADAHNAGRFGISVTEGMKLGLKYYDDLKERIPRAEVAQLYKGIQGAAFDIDPHLRVECMGSFRRGQADCGDIDILLTRDTGDGKDHSGAIKELVKLLCARGSIAHTLSNPEDWNSLDAKWMGLINGANGKMRRIDILSVPYNELGAALIYFTGNDIFNRSLRLKARHMGYSLNQHGLFKDVIRDRKTGLKYTAGTCIASRTEQEIFKVLGTPWRPPTERLP